ncbi:hypothetical protein HNQ79_005466 [Streptomyces candidus]|uniref:DUF624 domain-containing protein n=1 Tax=Streptomyces candidus TaxID=67283 RepID=A0A7X0HJS4_9ACTN|nr:hypothetical protein [Streptomyces candidus]GHH44386.1 hypothetical protein GCM10018773_31910 [Streptomyces candidus]
MNHVATARSNRRSSSRFPGFGARFAVFAECLLVGVWVVLASLPLITYPAAVAAGGRHLQRHLRQEVGGVREFAADWRAAVRHGWAVGVAGWVALWLLWLNVAAVRAGLPGGGLVGVVGAVAFLAALVAGVRAAVSWKPGASWRVLLGAAARRTVLDPAGSLLLVAGFAVVVVSGRIVLPLAVPVVGAVIAGALAVEARYAAGRRGGSGQ